MQTLQTTDHFDPHGQYQAMVNVIAENTHRSMDVVADTRSIELTTAPDSTVPQLVIPGDGGAPTQAYLVNDVALQQFSSFVGLDIRTARRMLDNREYRDCFSTFCNRVFQHEPKARLLRLYDKIPGREMGIVRSFNSDAYKTFDHPDLLSEVVPILRESAAGYQVINAAITDRKMYLRVKSSEYTGTGAHVGDVMAQGLLISNSETGHGSVLLSLLCWTLICLNGMQVGKPSRNSHITSSRADSDVWGLLSDEARTADNAALKLKVRDVASHYASRETFDAVLQQFKSAGKDTLADSTTAAVAVEQLGRVLQLTKPDTARVLDGLFSTLGQSGYAGQPISRATLVNAVTRVGNNPDTNTDDVEEWHKRGGVLLNLPRNQWQSIASAVPTAVPAAAA